MVSTVERHLQFRAKWRLQPGSRLSRVRSILLPEKPGVLDVRHGVMIHAFFSLDYLIAGRRGYTTAQLSIKRLFS
jgi:hypothetical protein